MTLLGLGPHAQPSCPDSGWANEPVQDPESCCILFEMLPSTLDFPWNFWIVTAEGVNYTNADNSIIFPICFEEAGVENVVVTYIDAFGTTLCENNWTVIVEGGCGPPCENCVDLEEIIVTGAEACDYEFKMDYTIDPSCGEIMVLSETWDFGHLDGTGVGNTITNVFPEDGIYTVTATVEYTVDWDEEPCTQEQTIEVTVSSCSELDCSSFKLIEILTDEISMELPARDFCEDPTYEISVREFGSGVPFEIASYTLTEVEAGVFEATVTDLELCTPYEIQVELFCEGIPSGTCINEEAWITECPEPCAGCVDLTGIDIIIEDGCNYSFSADFEISDDCEGITIDAINWSFGFDGPDGGASGETVDASFLCAGEYRITATILYSSASGDECIARVSQLIEVTGCSAECESCYLDDCINTYYDLFNHNFGDCEYVFIFDHLDGECGEIDPDSFIYEWDFGHPDGFDWTTSHLITHYFPNDGTYTVKLYFYYQIIGEDEYNWCTITTEVEVTGCGEEHAPKMAEKLVSNFANSPLTTTTVPNPADENVTITVLDPTNTSDLDQLQLIIHDINGREVYRGTTTLGIQKMIDVSALESGLYFYEIRDGDALIIKKKLLIH